MKNAFKVTVDDGTVIEFEPSVMGLYFYNFTKSIERNKIKEGQERIKNAMVIEAVVEIK
jgi:hypothetical protein